MTATALGPRDHTPRSFLPFRALQLFLALVVLAFGAYGVATIPTPGDVLIVVAALFSILASTYHILALSDPPRTSLPFPFPFPKRMYIYSLRATLALDAFLALTWLGAAGTLTSELVIIHALTRRYGRRPYGESDGWVGVLGGAAGTGGVEVLLHIISLAIHWRLYRQRAAGGRRTPRGRRTLGEGVMVAGVGSVAFGVASFPVVMELEGGGLREGEKLGEGERTSDGCGDDGKEDV